MKTIYTKPKPSEIFENRAIIYKLTIDQKFHMAKV